MMLIYNHRNSFVDSHRSFLGSLLFLGEKVVCIQFTELVEKRKRKYPTKYQKSKIKCKV